MPMARFHKSFDWPLPGFMAVLAIAVAAGISAAQSADTTQPAADVPAQWRQAVADVRQALSGELPQGRQSALANLVTDDTLIHRFNRLERDSAQQMCDQLAGLSPIYQQAYAGVPQTLAGDIAASVHDASLPDPVKKQLVLDDEALRRANTTATAWLTQTLEPATGDLVGVVVFCSEASASQSGDSTEAPTIQFVVFKGCRTARGLVLTRMVYGDPLKLDN